MALVKCPNCGNKISSSAEKCPHCGYSLSQNLIEVESTDVLSSESALQPTKVIHIPRKITLTKKSIALITIVLALLFLSFFINRLTPDEKYQVQLVTEQIDSIGQVEIYSGDKILSVEEQYNQLSSKCKRHVKNRSTLKNSKNQWNKLQAEKVVNQIDELSDIKNISEIKLHFAETAYKNLTDEQKNLVGNYNKLNDAKEAFSDSKIQTVKDLINSIGTISSIDADTKDKISKAEQAYNGTLSDEEKAKVDNYAVLQAAHEQFASAAVENCINAIDQIGEVTLESGQRVDDATHAYLLVFNDDKDKVTNHLKLDEATKTLVALKDAEAERQKTLAAGSSFSNDKWSVTYKKSRISAKILPNSTYGYYTYYYCQDDSVYVDLVFSVKNVNTDMLSLERIVSKGSVTYDGRYTYSSYTLFTSSGNDIDNVYSWDGLDALQSTTLHVAFIIPREAQSSSAPIKVTLTIAGEEKIINVR